MSTTARIAVTGATGRQGGAVARALAARGHRVRALTRRPASPEAAALAALGIEVAACDLGDPAGLDRALAGAAALFLTTTPYEHGVAEEERLAGSAVDAARRAGVDQLVYTSVAAADRPTGVAHFESKGRIEGVVAAAGFEHVAVLRPTFFMDMFLAPAFRRALARGRIELAMAADTRMAMVAVEDIAAFATLAFEQPGRLDGAVIELAGAQPSMTELAAAMSGALGRPVVYAQVGDDGLDPGIRPRLVTQRWCETIGWQIDMAALAAAWPVPLTGIAEWARRHRAVLGAVPEAGTA